MRFQRPGRRVASQCREGARDDADEHQLTELHAHVERKQRQWDVAARQAYFRERAGKTEAVQQPEAERHYPWPTRCKALLATAQA